MAVHSSCVAVLGTALMLAFSAPAGADWPLYGHDLANTRSAGGDGPAPGKVAGLQRAWTFASPNGDFTGTPVVAAGTLVAGTNLGSIYALDAVTGKLRWSRDVGQPINGSAAIDLQAPEGATVFVPVAQIGGPRLLALSLSTGEVRWDAVLSRQEGADVFGSPVFWRGTVYIGTSGPNNDEARARGSVVALDESTGSTRWQTYTVPEGHDGGAVWSTPAIDTTTGRLYVGTGNAYHEPAADTTDAMLALGAQTGEVLGRFQATAGDVWQLNAQTEGPDHDFGASANLITSPDGRALVGEGAKSGIYWALDRVTMKPVWSTAVGPGSAVGGILASTAYDGDRIYGNDTIDGAIWALGRDGSKRWDSTDGGTLHFSPVSVANGVLYSAGPSGFLTARDTASGAVLAKLPLDGPAFGGVSAVGGAVYVETGTGPAPQPGPPVPDTSKMVGSGSIIAFGDTSRSGAAAPAPAAEKPRARRAARIRLSVTPQQVEPGRLVAYRFRVRRGSHPLARVTIRLAGHRVRTNRAGRATLRARLRREGTYLVRARRGRRALASATIVVARPRQAPPPPAQDGPDKRPSTFSGRCEFSGAVEFQPPLTNTPQSFTQRVKAPGTCSGSFVDRRGGAHDLTDASATFMETSQATDASCLSGTATGAGTLDFPDGTIAFGFSETRAGGTPLVTLTGKASGSAAGTANPNASEDPAATVERCNGSGLDRFAIDIHMATTPAIAG